MGVPFYTSLFKFVFITIKTLKFRVSFIAFENISLLQPPQAPRQQNHALIQNTTAGSFPAVPKTFGHPEPPSASELFTLRISSRTVSRIKSWGKRNSTTAPLMKHHYGQGETLKLCVVARSTSARRDCSKGCMCFPIFSTTRTFMVFSCFVIQPV